MSKLQNVIALGEKDFAEGRGTVLELAEVRNMTAPQPVTPLNNPVPILNANHTPALCHEPALATCLLAV